MEIQREKGGWFDIIIFLDKIKLINVKKTTKKV